MANPEHLAILRKHKWSWENWRNENPEVIPDLRNAYFSSDDLSNANLSKANLSNADLSNADLRFADLSNANLSKANLSKANLRDANLSGANLEWARLEGTNLSGANLESVNLSRAFILIQNIYFSCYKANFTGICIQEDWKCPSLIDIDEVICEYVYIINDDETKERIPKKGNFAPGDFARLWQQKKSISRNISQSDNTINNQRVQFFDQNIYYWKELKFKSKTEIKIAEALERAGVLFFPNCLARLNTLSGRGNKEPDFLICYNGQWGILEVDGPQHDTPEHRVKDEERDQSFKKNGIKVVERFDSERCYKNPDEVVQEFLKMIDIGYS